MILIQPTENHLKQLYEWTLREESPEYHTCRPIHKWESYEAFYEHTKKNLDDSRINLRVLVDMQTPTIALGQIKGFDYNPRNQSMEFGYYLPRENRGRGYGTILVLLFIQEMFRNESLNLNKLYAMTASNNLSSINLLEGQGFKRDGANREHYKISGIWYDQYVYSVLKHEWHGGIL